MTVAFFKHTCILYRKRNEAWLNEIKCSRRAGGFEPLYHHKYCYSHLYTEMIHLNNLYVFVFFIAVIVLRKVCQTYNTVTLTYFISKLLIEIQITFKNPIVLMHKNHWIMIKDCQTNQPWFRAHPPLQVINMYNIHFFIRHICIYYIIWLIYYIYTSRLAAISL